MEEVLEQDQPDPEKEAILRRRERQSGDDKQDDR